MVLAVSARAVPFNYNEGDVLVCFRQTPSGSYDFVADAGPVSTFTNLPVGNQIVISPTYYTGSQLGVLDTNNIAWSAFAYYKSGSNPNTIFLTDPWDYTVDPANYPDPWYCAPSSSQGAIIAYLSIRGDRTHSAMRLKKTSKRSQSTMHELNITPLLDLVFVLLVIFIITTP